MRAMTTTKAHRALLWGTLVAGGVGLVACQPPPGPNAAPAAATPAADANIGSVSLELTVAGTYQFNQMSYEISGNGFDKAATVDVTNSSTFSTVVSGVPFGTGYTGTLKAKDVGVKLMTCQGSATFDVTAAATTSVPIHMTCHETVNPPSVPVPRPAVYALGGLLLALGALRVRRADAR